MKVPTFLFTFLSCIASCSCAQSGNEDILVGAWMYKGILDRSLDIECPDLITFDNEGEYSIYNDCYAPDAVNPVVEKGPWKYIDGQNRIVLENRFFETNYFFSEKSDNQIEIEVYSISENQLILKIKKEDLYYEVYEKRI